MAGPTPGSSWATRKPATRSRGFSAQRRNASSFIRFCALASHLVELSQTVMHYLGAVFPGDPVSQPNQSPLNARQSAGSPEPSREALHEGHRRVASIA